MTTKITANLEVQIIDKVYMVWARNYDVKEIRLSKKYYDALVKLQKTKYDFYNTFMKQSVDYTEPSILGIPVYQSIKEDDNLPDIVIVVSEKEVDYG